MDRLILTSITRQKPALVLGARGSGKSHLARQFAGRFSNFIYLDLETSVDRGIFTQGGNPASILRSIGFIKGKPIQGKGTIIILDEIALCREALEWFMNWLQPGTAAGQEILPSLPFLFATSSFIDKPVAGLIDQYPESLQIVFLGPFSFEEFLMATGEDQMLEALREVPVPLYAYEKLLQRFHLYALIGGMPGIISEFRERKQIAGLKKTYERINERFLSVPAGSGKIRSGHKLAGDVLHNAYPFAATRISFNQFGNIGKGSREIATAFMFLQSCFLLSLNYPVTSSALPLAQDQTRFPRLQILDTGLVNYFSGIQKPLYQTRDMTAIFEGQVARQVAGQELVAARTNRPLTARDLRNVLQNGIPGETFWVRDKPQSTALVDFVIESVDLAVPVVVRSGEPGRLRSLHQFIDASPHPFAVRLSSEKLEIRQGFTLKKKRFFLLNLPYFLASRISEHLVGFRRYVTG